MGFVKVVKNNAYYKRFQVKNRRRREGKTDYFARRRLTHMDKNKYDSKKYRFVVRRTNQKIICQIIYATIQGDRVMAEANSSELRRFGVTAGLTNYAAAYCTGLLCARRVLQDLKMDDQYKGVEAADGEFFDVYEKGYEGRRPLKVMLDVGLVRTTTGNRVFGAMKGAVDGGLYIPHNTKRFPGYHVEKIEAVRNKRGKVEKKEGKSGGSLNAKEHREHIMGTHVQKYMDLLKKENKDKFTKQFKVWEKCLTAAKAANTEALYKKVHSEIRKSPARPKAAEAKPTRKVISKKGDKAVVTEDSKKRKYLRHTKLTLAERKARVAARIQKQLSK